MSTRMDSAIPHALDRPLADATLDDLRALFSSSAKPASASLVGLELEVFAHWKEDGRAIDRNDAERVLEAHAKALGWAPRYEENGMLVGLVGEGQSMSLEPGGQIEFATAPHRTLRVLEHEVLAHARRSRAIGDEIGIDHWLLGHHPYATLDDIPRMPKVRYDIMRAYLGSRGKRALAMMHLTSSVQTTVDFSDESNLVAKLRTAAKASPFLAALTSASPFAEGKPNGMKSLRYQIWLETDDERCGLWPEMVDSEGLTIERYLGRALDTPAMFFVRNGTLHRAVPKPYRVYAREGFDGTTVTVGDLVDHLTTFFPEIRPKGYLELRSADCLDPRSSVAVAAFWRGLLDDGEARQMVEDRLSAMSFEELRALQPRVAREGLDATSAAGPVREVARWLVHTAYTRLSRDTPDDAPCLVPLLGRADRGRSPADDMLEVWTRTGSIAKALELVTLSRTLDESP